jgi:hypothetical protein
MQSSRTTRLLGLLVLPALACGGLAHDVARDATPGVIEGAAEGLSDPETQRKIVGSIDPGRVREATRKTGGGVVDGVLDTFEDEKRQERMGALADRLVARGMSTLADPEKTAPVEAMISRIVSGSVASAIDTSMSRMLAEPTQERVREVTKTLVGDVVRSSFDAIGEGMGTPEDRKKAVGDLVHEISKQATLGFQSAIDEARVKRDAKGAEGSDGSVLVAVGDAAQQGKNIFFFVAIGLGVMTLALGALLAWALRKNRSRMAELSQRDDALLLLMETIKSTESQPWSSDLREAIKKTARDRDGGEHLRRILRARSDLRFGTGDAPDAATIAAAQRNGRGGEVSRYQHHS